MTEEIWKSVVGYESAYEVSDLGRVRSLDRVTVRLHQGSPRKFSYRGLILKPWINDSGYPCVTLLNRKKHRVHLLVLIAFVGPCPANMEGLHGDGDPKNACLLNLRWGTSKENKQDAIRHGTMNRGVTNGHAKLDEEKVRIIKSRSRSVTDLMREFRVGERTIYDVIDGTTWRHVS